MRLSPSPPLVLSLGPDPVAHEPADLEWDPYVPRLGGQGGPGKAALVQVCSDETILLVHVAKMSRACLLPRLLFFYRVNLC